MERVQSKEFSDVLLEKPALISLISHTILRQLFIGHDVTLWQDLLKEVRCALCIPIDSHLLIRTTQRMTGAARYRGHLEVTAPRTEEH